MEDAVTHWGMKLQLDQSCPSCTLPVFLFLPAPTTHSSSSKVTTPTVNGTPSGSDTEQGSSSTQSTPDSSSASTGTVSSTAASVSSPPLGWVPAGMSSVGSAMGRAAAAAYHSYVYTYGSTFDMSAVVFPCGHMFHKHCVPERACLICFHENFQSAYQPPTLSLHTT